MREIDPSTQPPSSPAAEGPRRRSAGTQVAYLSIQSASRPVVAFWAEVCA